MPKNSRGKAIAFNNAIHSLAKPIGAFATFALVPHVFFGLSGWRWVLLLGAAAALLVWPFRRMIPESPRWLAARGQFEAADKVVAELETKVMRERGKPLPPPEPALPPSEPILHEPPYQAGRYLELFSHEYLPRTLMLSFFNVLWAICIFGYLNWMPILLMNQGISITHSLGYTFVMALAAPLGPLAIMPFADKIERKWQIAGSALTIAAIGIVFSITRNPYIIIPIGALQVLSGAIFAYSFQTYQAELFSTRIRTQGIGFVYSWSRLSAILSGFVIAYIMRDHGVPAVFMLLSSSMILVVLIITFFGPLTNNKSLETLSP
jgi:putative MFS transporter